MRRSLLFPVLIAVFILSGAGVPETPDEQPPNIILILTDDIGYGDLGAYGQKKIQTPRLDEMAASGVRFTQYYAGSTVCAPSRWSLLTGVHMGHSYVRGNYNSSLRGEDVTVAELLKERGYRTGMFGKHGLGQIDDAGAPHLQGFDEFLGYLEHVHAHSYYTDHLFAIEDGTTVRVNIDTTDYTHDLFAEEALRFIRENADEPFFLYLPFTIAHAELLVPEESMAPYLDENGKSILMPDAPFPCCGVIGTYRAQDRPHAAFAGMISRLDRDVGRILDLLVELGIDDNTLVLFTSDNGPHDEGGADPGFFESNGPLRGLKRDLYEGGIRMPMIAWGPGLLSEYTDPDHPWASWDILPTLVDVAGGSIPEGVDGISMRPLLEGASVVPSHTELYWEFNSPWGGHHIQAIRMGDWKLLRFREPDRMWDELYDLSTDIGEYHDLSAHYPELVGRMVQRMSEVRTVPEVKQFRIPY